MNDKGNNNESNGLQFTEAPAGWNTRYVDPKGFECQITLRAVSGKVLLKKVNGAIAYLLENECVPYTYNRGGYRGNSNKNNSKVDKDETSNGNDQSRNHSSRDGGCYSRRCAGVY